MTRTAARNGRPGSDNRLLNGYEKFADRYVRYERREQAIDLYQMAHQAEPTRTSVMRRLADAYRNNGNIIGLNQYNQKALNALLAIQAKNPKQDTHESGTGQTLSSALTITIG